MFSNAEVGDKVWSVEFGWGIVVDNIMSICVKFDNFSCFDVEEYTKVGARLDSTENINQTLFWDEIEIIAPPKPNKLVKKWRWVVKWSTLKLGVTEAYYSSPKELHELTDVDEVLQKVTSTEVEMKEDSYYA